MEHPFNSHAPVCWPANMDVSCVYNLFFNVSWNFMSILINLLSVEKSVVGMGVSYTLLYFY